MPTINLLPAQMELLADVTTPIVGFVAGLGSGKTHGLVHKACQLAFDNPMCAGMYLAPTYGLIKDAIIPEFHKVLEQLDVEYSLFKSAPPHFTLHLPEGDTEIRLRSATNPETVGSASNLAWVVGDEIDTCDPETIKRVRTRVRDPRARRKQIVFGGTPEGRLLLYDMFVKNPPCNENTGEGLTRLIRAITDDNIHLDPLYLSTAFAGMGEQEVAQFRKGEFILPRGRVYGQLRDSHIQHCKNPFEGQLVMMVDFNVNPMSWSFGRIVGGELHIWGELIRENTDTIEQTREAAAILSRLLSADRGYHIDSYEAAGMCKVYGDASGKARKTSATKSDIEHLRAAGFQLCFSTLNPPVRDRVFSVSKRQKQDQFFIDPEGAPEVRKCFENQIWGKDGAPDKKAGLDHAVDGPGYLVHYEWPAQYPRGNHNFVVPY